jgi:hypothetical protein
VALRWPRSCPAFPVRDGLGLSSAQLGLLLLCLSGGSIVGLPAEPRTLLIGLLVLGFALIEGSANDWIAVAMVDGWLTVPGSCEHCSAYSVRSRSACWHRARRGHCMWRTVQPSRYPVEQHKCRCA